MNAPLRAEETKTATGALRLLAFFHLNLAFSSIEEEQRAEVIAKCYWPLLRLAQSHGPIGIEASGFTLEEIAARDPDWIAAARELLAEGKIELIGSGYAQMIAPLVPWRVTEANLRIGNEIYQRLLGVRPRIALVNEQAYSGGLPGLYREAGYEALLMDWDNPGSHNPQWDSETRFRPQTALGADGQTIRILWTNTVAFQKLQRFAHGDIPLAEYLDYMAAQRGDGNRLLCAYASDAEIFDFRPGRYKTEEKIGTVSEWAMLAEAFTRLRESNFGWVAPLAALDGAATEQPLRLETPACPIPVKKQRKYNLSRWAVTGRDDIGVNAACQRIYEGMIAGSADGTAWKILCGLWASDFRTHITDRRWRKFCADLHAAEARHAAPLPPLAETLDGTPLEARNIEIATPQVVAKLDRRRGLALTQVRFTGQAHAAIGGLALGHFDDIGVQADWYSGNCVFEAPGEHKITDLEWCQTRRRDASNGDIMLQARLETRKGLIEKNLRFHAAEPRIDFDLSFHWEDWGKGSLRLGHFTLLPEAFDWQALTLITHNGGRESEHFALSGHGIDHGAPVSFLVSASHGLGMTEGWAALTDGTMGVRIAVDRATTPLLGMLTHKRIGGSLFCQLQLSALELDDTRKPDPYARGPRRFRFSLAAL
jgi:hypothetical protein